MCDKDNVSDGNSAGKIEEALTQGGVSDKSKSRLAARRRLEDMKDQKALREQMGDDFYNDI